MGTGEDSLRVLGMDNHVELSTRAARDLRGLTETVRTQVVIDMRANLAADPPPENADVKALQGAAPWLRLRSGDFRVLYRPMTIRELKAVGVDGRRGLLVARIVNRRDLTKAIRSL